MSQLAGSADARDSAPLEVQAYDAVIRWLSRGEVKPGEPLPLREAAKRLGMSRTPVRAAIWRLHEQRIVSYNPRYGFSLALPTIGDLYELFDLRTMCETHALRSFLGTAEPVPATLPRLAQEMWDLAGRIEQDPAAYAEYSTRDRQLHGEIVALGGSGRLAEWYGQLNLFTIIFRLGWTVARSEGEFRISAREHLSVMEAMANRDRTEAVRRLEAHLLRVRDQTIARLTRAGPVPLAAARGGWLDRMANGGAAP